MRLRVLAVIVATLSTVTASRPLSLPQARQTPAGSPKVEFVTVEELKSKIAKNEPVTIIDVRGPSSYEGSDKKIKGSIHVKLRAIQARLRGLARDQEIVTYCACPADETSIRAAELLLGSGFKRVRALKGGWDSWIQAGGQVETKPKTL